MAAICADLDLDFLDQEIQKPLISCGPGVCKDYRSQVKKKEFLFITFDKHTANLA